MTKQIEAAVGIAQVLVRLRLGCRAHLQPTSVLVAAIGEAALDAADLLKLGDDDLLAAHVELLRRYCCEEVVR